MNIAVLDMYGFQTCFGSAASAFENIELPDVHCALKKNFRVTFKGYVCFATTNTLRISIDRDYRRIFLGMKCSISGFFFGWENFGSNFLGSLQI